MATGTLPRLAVLSAAFLFSTGGIAIKATSWDGFAVAGGRCLVAAIVLALWLPRWRRFWDREALMVGVPYAATMVLFAVANKLTPAANAIFLQSTAPLYVLVLAPWLLGERTQRRDVLLTGVLAIGMLLFFVGREPPQGTAPDPARGNAIALAAGVSWAFTLVGLRWIGRAGAGKAVLAAASDRAGAAVVAGSLLAAAACVPLAQPPPALEVRDLALVAYLGVFQIGLAYVLLTRGVERMPALEVALLLLLEPVLSALLAWAVLGERPGAWAQAGCVVILAGTVARTLLAMRGVRGTSPVS